LRRVACLAAAWHGRPPLISRAAEAVLAIERIRVSPVPSDRQRARAEPAPEADVLTTPGSYREVFRHGSLRLQHREDSRARPQLDRERRVDARLPGRPGAGREGPERGPR